MRRAAVAALALLLAAIVGCSDSRVTNPDRARHADRTTEPVNKRVLMIGDSNLFGSARPVDEALRDAGFEPTLHGVPGYGLKHFDVYWSSKLPELLRVDPAVVVVGLGTNDTFTDTEVFLVPSRIDQMMEAIGDHEVVWLTHVDDRPGAAPTAGVAVNEAIRAAAARWPNLVILDFAEVIAANPNVLREDALHFSSTGALTYARSITEAVADVFVQCGGEVEAGCV